MDSYKKNAGFASLYIIIGIVVLALVGGYFVMSRSHAPVVASVSPTDMPTDDMMASSSATVTPSDMASISPSASPSGSPKTSAKAKTFTVTGSNFKFDVSQIKVKKGDTVKIVFKNSGGKHNWVIDEFKAQTPVIGSGENATVSFVADKVGTFEYYCSVGSHRQMGMKGNLIVE